MKLLQLALRNVFRNRLRASLTMSSVVLVVVLIVAFSSLLSSFELEDVGALGATRIFVQHTGGWAQFLPIAHRQRIEGIPGVVAVEEVVSFSGAYGDERPPGVFWQLATDASVWPRVHEDYEIPGEQLRVWQSQRNSFIAGKALAERLGWRLGDHIHIQGSYLPVNLDLVLAGTFRCADESLIYFHYAALEGTWITRLGQAETFILRVRRPEDVPRVIDAIEALFENSDAPVKAMPERQFRLQFVEMLGNVKLLIRMIATTVLVTIVLIVGNTMAMSARERTTEMAVLKAFGFKRHHVLALVLFEAMILAMAGAVAGVALSFPVTRALVDVLKNTPAAVFAHNMHIGGESLGIAFGVAVAIGTFSGFIPAVRSSRVPVAIALRQVV